MCCVSCLGIAAAAARPYWEPTHPCATPGRLTYINNEERPRNACEQQLEAVQRLCYVEGVLRDTRREMKKVVFNQSAAAAAASARSAIAGTRSVCCRRCVSRAACGSLVFNAASNTQ